ncbi:MAG: hypothetical protein FWF77_01475 [Defluviitaleaceae bacterium]|nr:hypothetical protein [Defluviitaleaceae bacterium]
MAKSTHSLEAGSRFLTRKKARQARSGNRGHVAKSTHSPEAGSRFLTRKKARQARSGNRGHVAKSTHSPEAGSSFLDRKKAAVPPVIFAPECAEDSCTPPRKTSATIKSPSATT